MSSFSLPPNPFPGLRPFREDEEAVFFGREAQVDSMIDKLASTRFLAVVGTSGSGKSSLVNCGLVPALHRGFMAVAGSAWRVAMLRPGNRPLRALAEALSRPDTLGPPCADASGFTPAEMMEATLRMSKLGLVDAFVQARLEARQNLLVVVDQFEELFRYQDLAASTAPGSADAPARSSEDATAFVNLLLEVLEHRDLPVFLVLTMRSDFLGECAQFFGLPEAVNRGQYLVPRMTRDERRSAIAEPLRVSGAEIEPVLLTRLVNDVGDNPDQLSILQHALNRTWACWQQDGVAGALTLGHYERAGTMADALNKHADEAFDQLADGRPREIAAALFKAITDKVTDIRGTRRPTRLDLLCKITDAEAVDLQSVIDVFREPARSFLMPPYGTELRPDTPIDISHETLMRAWKRLRDWGDEEAQSAHTYRGLAETAERHRDGHAALLRQPDLQFTLDWEQRQHPNAAWAGRYRSGFEMAMEFLRQSRIADEEERRKESARIRRRLTLTGIAVAALVVIAGSLFVLNREAKRAQLKAEASRSDAENLVSFLIGEQFLEKLRPVGSNDLLAAVQTQVQHYLNRHSDGDAPSTLRTRALALRNEGDMLESRGMLAAAIEQFRESARLFERVAAGHGKKSEDRVEQARALERMADSLLDTGKLVEALASSRAALALRQTVAASAVQDEDHLIELSLGHSSVAQVLNRMGRPREALVQHLEPALALLDKLQPSTAAVSPKKLDANFQLQAIREGSLAWMGNASGSKAAYEQATEIAKKWNYARPLAADARVAYVAMISSTERQRPIQGRKAGVSASKAGVTAAPQSRGAPAGATRAIEVTAMEADPLLRGDAQEWTEELKQIRVAMKQLVTWDPSNANWKRSVAAISLLLATELTNSGEYDGAQIEIDQAQPTLLDLEKIDKSNQSAKSDLGWLYQVRADLANARAHAPQAMEDFRTAEQYYAAAATASPDDVSRQSDSFWTLFRHAQALSGADSRGEALALLRSGRAKVTALIQSAPETSVLHTYLLAFYRAEVESLDAGDDKQAAAAVAREWREELKRALAAEPENVDLLKEAYLVEVHSGNQAKAAGKTEEALADYSRATESVRTALKIDPENVELWEKLRDSQKSSGDVLAAGNQWTEGEKSYHAALTSAERAFELKPKSGTANKVYLVRLALGDTLKSAGTFDAALSEFDQALVWIAKAIKLDPKDAVCLNNQREAYVRIAQVHQQRKDGARALKALADAVGPGAKAVALAPSPETKAEYANRMLLLEISAGDLYRAEPKVPDQALRHYTLARAWIDQSIAAMPRASLYTSNLGVLHRRIAATLRDQNDTAGEEAALHSSVGAGERAAKIASTHEDVSERAKRLGELHDAYSELAEFYERNKDTHAASSAYGSSIDALRQAATLEPKRPSNFVALARLYVHAANSSKTIGDSAAAQAQLRGSVEAAANAAALATSDQDFEDAALALYEYAEYLEDQKQWNEAMQAYRGASAQATLAAQANEKNATHRRALSFCQRKVGEMLENLHDSADAAANFDLAVEAGNKAVALEPTDSTNLWGLYQAQWSRARNLESQGKRSDALTVFEDALQNAKQTTNGDDIKQLQQAIAELRR